MSDVTEMLLALDRDDPRGAEVLLPAVYDELRRLAKQKMAGEAPGHILDATGLVHEAWLRLVGAERGAAWENRRHFFAAAAEAMRRVLIESARRRSRLKRGGDRERVELEEPALSLSLPIEQLLAIDEALEKLGAGDPEAAEIVKLKFFAGFSLEEAAKGLGISRAKAYRHWTYARAWLQCELEDGG
ncbi:MAG: sigma-70 family RNA polymerase sigma factor [Planctomycetes bacterium]|nr:sigma-70 family RNA polymerase sigma factor [Planctomycetota bacterium]